MTQQIRTALPPLVRAEPGQVARTGALAALVLVAFALRLVPVLIVPSLNWGDEVFQATEQAHRLVFGTGLVPWEFQVGMRSWLLPGIFAGLMEFSRLFGDGPDFYLPVIAAACGALAMAPVVCCFLWCERWCGLSGGILGGLFVAVAPELVYMGDRTLSEVLAAHLLVLALYMLAPGYWVTSRARCFWAGAILGLAFLLRIQIAPAIALIALCTMTCRSREYFWAAAGGAAGVLALAALLDTATLGYPLASIWRNLAYNLYYGASSTFGTERAGYYVLGELAIWGTGFSLLLILALVGTRRMWLPLAAAGVIVAVHSAIAHKEYRFIYPAILLLSVQAGIGFAELVEGLRDRIGTSGRWRIAARRAIPVLAATGWCLLSLLIWSGPVMAAFRHRAHDYILAANFVARDPTVCGIGLWGPEGDAWVKYGGYSYLHRPVPMYWPQNRRELAATAGAFDVMLYTLAPAMPPGFVQKRCFGAVCLARRAGSCKPVPMMPMPFPAPLAGFDAQG